jgi:hypothetical protein
MAAHSARSARRVRRVRRSTHRIRRLLPVLAALVSVATAIGVAFAYFTSTGNGVGTATTATLAPPTGVSGAQTPGTGTVTVLWQASTGTPSPTGYYVTRDSGSGPAEPACSTSPAAPTTATTCADTGVGLGTYTYVVVAVYRSWTAASAARDPVTVAQTPQSITFTSTPTEPSYGGSYSVSATGGGSGNPVVFSSATTDVCTVTGALVTFVHAGSCTIDADQAGSTYYAAAPRAQQTFTVAKAAQTITFTSTAPTDVVLGDPGYAPTATGGDSGNPVTFTVDATTSGTCTIVVGVVTYQHAGSCTVDADQAGDGDHLDAPQVQQSWAVGKGAQAITFTSPVPTDAKVGGGDTVAATGGPSGNPVEFSSATPGVCTVTGSAVSYVGAGTCTIDADQAGSDDYLPAGQVQQTFPVTRNDQSITFTSTAPTNAKVGGATYHVSASATSGLPVTFSSGSTSVCTVSGSTVSFVGVGTCVVDADQPGNAAYDPAPQAQQAFAVAAGDTTAPALTGIMDGRTPRTWQNDNKGNGSWNKDACSGNQLCVTITDVGAGATGVDAGTVTFTLEGTSGANSGKCFDSSAGDFVSGPCTIDVTYDSGTGLATASVPQSVMTDGSYSFTVRAKDNAGNLALQTTGLSIT